MRAIFKRELKSYFTGVFGYLFSAFLLFVVGLYFTVNCLVQASPYFGYVIGSISFVFIIAVPLLTMRTLAEDRKMKTDQLIMTAPVSVTRIVLGKYLALVTVFFIPCVLICLYPLILGHYGTIPYTMAYSAILAFFLYGCTCLSIGLFLSSLTENPMLAAVLTFAVLFADYLVSGIGSIFGSESNASFLGIMMIAFAFAIVFFMLTKSLLAAFVLMLLLGTAAAVTYNLKPELFTGLIQNVAGALDITKRMDDFINGVFNLSNIIYFVTVSALFVFLTIQSVEKRRWS
ncbi:MAG: ABC transporter permease [Lachnospiraceae bacterium]|nr:ABC transporter permease [Lachnospiraceae bacterium]